MSRITMTSMLGLAVLAMSAVPLTAKADDVSVKVTPAVAQTTQGATVQTVGWRGGGGFYVGGRGFGGGWGGGYGGGYRGGYGGGYRGGWGGGYRGGWNGGNYGGGYSPYYGGGYNNYYYPNYGGGYYYSPGTTYYYY